MANVGGPNNNQPQPDLQAFKNAADGARDNTQIKVDRNTGNVGTRSLFGRAWRAVTPQNSDRRESNRSDIEKFRVALLNQTALLNQKKDSSATIESALDRSLPGRESGNVPLTAGAVRRSIEYVNIRTMTVASAVDHPQFRNVINEGFAPHNLDFYLEARDMLGDGADRIDVGEFKSVVARYLDVGGNQEINIPDTLRENMTRFAEYTNVPSYSAAQSEYARHMLQDAQREVARMMRGNDLTKLKGILLRQLDQR